MKTRSKSIQRRIALQRKPRKASAAIVKAEPISLAERIEKVLISGDLTPLTPEERLSYYKAVCKSLGLNPLTRPFDYILFRENDGGPGRLQLYARKDCTEQLRKKYGVGVTSLKREIADGVCIVEATVRDASGRTDAATGVVSLSKYKDGKYILLAGKERDNAIMKAETKAKRRATLSICGLGFLDESEIETVENYNMVTPGGRIIEEQTGSREAAQAVAAHKIEDLKAKVEKAEGIPMASSPASAPSPKRIMSIKTMPDHDVAVSGYLADEEMQKFLADVAAVRFKSQKDGSIYWRFHPEYLEDFKALCVKLGIEVR